MKNFLILIAVVSTTLFLSACSGNSMHAMDDGSTMSGATHEEATKAQHGMDDGSTMSGATMESGSQADEDL